MHTICNQQQLLCYIHVRNTEQTINIKTYRKYLIISQQTIQVILFLALHNLFFIFGETSKYFIKLLSNSVYWDILFK